MKLLFLSQLLPYPLDAGAKVRAYYMLRYLAQSHQVTLVCFVRGDDSAEAIRHLESICAGVHCVPMRRSGLRNLRAGLVGLLTGRPLVIVRDEIREMYALLGRLMAQERFDLVHADQTSMAGYGLWAVEQADRPIPAVLDQHNAVHLLTQRMAEESSHPLLRLVMAREARAFRRYEAHLCRRYNAVLTVTQEDKSHLLALFPPQAQAEIGAKFTPLPIAVDPERVQPVSLAQSGPGDKAPTILHVGTMFWPPNVAGVLWFAQEVLPLIRQAVGDVRFVVVGKQPPAPVRALAQDPRIRVLGYVEDLRPLLEEADLFVVPLAAGGGMRVKILDAWLWGLPVVSTLIGAEGIAVEEEKNILLADTPAGFAQAAVRLLTDRELNLSLRRAGRAWVESRYSWSAVYGEVGRVYERLAPPPPQTAGRWTPAPQDA